MFPHPTLLNFLNTFSDENEKLRNKEKFIIHMRFRRFYIFLISVINLHKMFSFYCDFSLLDAMDGRCGKVFVGKLSTIFWGFGRSLNSHICEILFYIIIFEEYEIWIKFEELFI
jgi:hypothetical protein